MVALPENKPEAQEAFQLPSKEELERIDDAAWNCVYAMNAIAAMVRHVADGITSVNKGYPKDDMDLHNIISGIGVLAVHGARDATEVMEFLDKAYRAR